MGNPNTNGHELIKRIITNTKQPSNSQCLSLCKENAARLNENFRRYFRIKVELN